MSNEPTPAQFPAPSAGQSPAPSPLAPQGWTAVRWAAALAIAGANDRRIAAAAAQLLSMHDHGADFAAWCDAHIAGTGPDRST
jgi:hypothetical protein